MSTDTSGRSPRATSTRPGSAAGGDTTRRKGARSTAAQPETDPTMLTLMPPELSDVLAAFLNTTESAESPQHDYAVLLAALCQLADSLYPTDLNVAHDTRRGIWGLLALPATFAALGTPAPAEQVRQLADYYAALFEALYHALYHVALGRERDRKRRAKEMSMGIFRLVNLPTVRASLSAACGGERPIPSPAVLSTLHVWVIAAAAGRGDVGALRILSSTIERLFTAGDVPSLPWPTSRNLAASSALRTTTMTHWRRISANLARGQIQEARAHAAGFDLGRRLCSPDLAAAQWAALHHQIMAADVAAAKAQYAVVNRLLAKDAMWAGAEPPRG